ncbi:MAG: sigma-70 family RNA polymerase sigma factor [Puniceicoccales bacterium]|jgi:RNA polymerase sigma-70 factor (ECF subfamily)|nr:sigma-70 family RNA polymerase sigma factor [Puniceicoccales bacterium]
MAPETAATPPKTPVDTLVREHQRALIGYARSLVRNDATAHDIVQETFLRLCKSPQQPANPKAWLYRVCRTRAIDWWRQNQREHLIPATTTNDDNPDTDFFERQPDPAPTPPDTLEHTETLHALNAQLETLTPRQRELLRLKFQAGLSYKEIATATGLTPTNVGFILHTTLATLRQRLNKATAQPSSLS